MNKRVLSLLFTIGIIGFLLLTGPALGFTLDLKLDKTETIKGEIIKFTAEIDIPGNEYLSIDELRLELSGPEEVSCKFDVSGNIINGCKGITIKKKQNSLYSYGYGYGYGYTSGKLIYEISLDTSDYEIGDYESELKVKISGSESSKKGDNFTMGYRSGGSCFTQWICSDWSECVNGEQTRTCKKEIANCYSGKIPEETRECDSGILNLALNSGNDEDQVNEEDLENEDQDNLESDEGPSGITGAITGVVDSLNSGTGVFIIIVTFVVLGAFFLIRFFIRRY